MHNVDVRKVPPLHWRTRIASIAIPEHCTSAALTLPCWKAMFEWKAVRCAGGSPRGNVALALALPVHCKDLRQFSACTVS